jgi:hypothetical protein
MDTSPARSGWGASPARLSFATHVRKKAVIVPHIGATHPIVAMSASVDFHDSELDALVASSIREVVDAVKDVALVDAPSE